MARIDSVESDFYRVPLPMALTDSTHGVMAEASSSPCAFVCRPGASSRSFSGMFTDCPHGESCRLSGLCDRRLVTVPGWDERPR